MSNDIVTVNVSVTATPIPSKLQQTGACISNGATTLAPGVLSNAGLITEPADLLPLLVAPLALTSLSWTADVVTGTTTTPHGYTNGEQIYLTIAGATPAGYNGTFLATVTGAETFTYPLANNPGTETVPGTVTPGAVKELTSMIDTFFSNGSNTSVYVLEVGPVSSAVGIAALATYVETNPFTLYTTLLPRSWAGDATLLPFGKLQASNTSKFYMFTTCTLEQYAQYATTKCFVTAVEAPDLPATEFDLASLMWVVLSYNPSTTNKVTPTAFSFVQGVTASDFSGPTMTALKAAGCNFFVTGAEGGLTDVITKWGTTADSRDFTYWYSVDWTQINLKLNLANEIINGSNNPINPLYYNQAGINRLTKRAQSTVNSGITFGLVLAPAAVQAVPFSQYVVDNPDDYPLGVYNGLSLTYTPARGFTQITFNVNVTDFITQ